MQKRMDAALRKTYSPREALEIIKATDLKVPIVQAYRDAEDDLKSFIAFIYKDGERKDHGLIHFSEKNDLVYLVLVRLDENKQVTNRVDYVFPSSVLDHAHPKYAGRRYVLEEMTRKQELKVRELEATADLESNILGKQLYNLHKMKAELDGFLDPSTARAAEKS